MITSIYIPINSFDFLFNTTVEGITLNLGGRSLFYFSEDAEKIQIRRRINEDYIENFWNEGISNISAIVGKNGSGKTSLLRSISNLDTLHKPSIYIFENLEGEIRILNQTKKVIQFEGKHTLIKNLNRIANLYYSPVIDFDLISTRSPITLVNSFKHAAENYRLKSTARNIRLMNSPIAHKLHQVYPDFPIYDKVILTIAPLSKDFFLNPYLQANFANPHTGDVVINTIIDPELNRLKEDNQGYSAANAIKLLEYIKNRLRAESFSQHFKDIWDLEIYKNTSNNNIHNTQNFVRNLEVSILSFLMLNSVYVLRGLEGKQTDLSFINNGSDFIKMLNGFTATYIDNVNGVWYTLIKEKFGDIDIKDIDKYIDFIEADKFISISGLKVKDLKIDIKNRLNLIKSFYNLYTVLCSVFDVKGFEGYIELDIKKDLVVFETIMKEYETVIQFSNSIPVEFSMLNFLPNKMLSNGEKSLIDLYSSIFTYLKDNRHNTHLTGEGALLLLDEAELGYHPVWKRKFIDALNETLPILFKDTIPKVFNEESKDYEIIEGMYPVQVIFTTHDALTLSDMPQDKIIYVSKNDQNSDVNLETSSKKTFGANIFDLFSESFFIDDLLIGDFADKVINEAILWINENKEPAKRSEKFHTEFERNRKIINLIDEPILKTKLLEMMDELKDSKELEIEFLEEEARKIWDKINKLKQ